MIPVKSNTAEQGCSPVSSNCVVWQGPSLSCINLCNGDTVSDVVYKMAVNLCSVQEAYDLSDVDLSCLVTFCTSSNPAPTTKTLPAVLDFIVSKVCCLNTRVETLEEAGGESSPATLPLVQLPTCLQYVDGGTGQTVTELVLNQYTLRLANQFCSLKATVDTHTSQISSLTSRVTTLENAPAVTLPTVVPNCLLTPGTPTAMNVLLDELESQYCQLRAVLGSNTQITAATAAQCIGLGSATALSQAGTMSSISGWNNTVTTMAQAFQNLWITVCDMRAVIGDLKNCCSQVDCTQFILNYDASANEDRTEVTLDFNPGTIIPAGFANAVSGSSVVISDGTTTKTFTLDLVSLAASGELVLIVAGGSVVGAALNTSQPYTITVNGNISKDGQSCSKTVTKNISVPCPIVSNVTATLS